MSLGVSARLNLRFGPRATLLPGLVLVAIALAYFSRAPVDGDYVTDVLPVVVLLGAGAGLVFPALTTISMSGVLPHDAGLASGVVNTSMQVGGAFGLAVLATLASDRTETLRTHGDSVAQRADRRLPARVPRRRRAGRRRDPARRVRAALRSPGARGGARGGASRAGVRERIGVLI